MESPRAQAVSGLLQAGLLSPDMALTELRDAGRVTGRFTGVTDEAVAAAKVASAAPSLPEGMSPASPAPETAGASSEEHTPQEISLNGAQVTSMVQIVTQVAAGQLPRSSGVQMLLAAFPVSAEPAERIMGDVGRGFTAAQENGDGGQIS